MFSLQPRPSKYCRPCIILATKDFSSQPPTWWARNNGSVALIFAKLQNMESSKSFIILSGRFICDLHPETLLNGFFTFFFVKVLLLCSKSLFSDDQIVSLPTHLQHCKSMMKFNQWLNFQNFKFGYFPEQCNILENNSLMIIPMIINVLANEYS